VDPVPDPLLFRKSGSTGNRTRTINTKGGGQNNGNTKKMFLLAFGNSYDFETGQIVVGV
jgi:hypothetical protein